MDNNSLVLVTGASGFIATHVIQQLQRAGYRVRGTVRSLKNEEKVKPIRLLCPEARHPIELVEADLCDPTSWPAALRGGVHYVLHVASPLPKENPKHDDEVIKPALEGTLNVLKACREAGTVRRVVLTSSVAAISNGFDQGGDKTYNEEDWTDLANCHTPYYRSKTLAERAAWEFVKEHQSDGPGPCFELATINPGFVMGPILCGGEATSMEIPRRLLERQMPMLPQINFGICDVRDVAAAHLKAMISPEAVGHRHIITSGSMWLSEVAEILNSEFGPQGYNVPTKVAPKFMLQLLSIFDKGVRMILPSVGKVTKLDNRRMVKVLAITPRDTRATLLDMCYSMIDTGFIKKTAKYVGQKMMEDH